MVTVRWVPHKAIPTQATVFFDLCKSQLVDLYTLSRGWECSVSLNLSLGVIRTTQRMYLPRMVDYRKEILYTEHYLQLRFRTSVLSHYGICHNTASVLRFGFLAITHMGSQLSNQGSTHYPLHWKVKSQPLDRQGGPQDKSLQESCLLRKGSQVTLFWSTEAQLSD